MSLLDALSRAGVLRSLDHAFALSLRRLDPQTPDAVLAAAALAALAPSLGHAGFDPAQPARMLDAALAWPEAALWQAQLAASAWVDLPDDEAQPAATQTPLVFEHGLLYLRRYREYERRLALGLRRLAAASVIAADTTALAPLFAQLFPQAREGDDDQARAAALALRQRLLLISGGPGTGKTTTIARVLVLRLALARLNGTAAPRIALAAPTGRAAERIAESLRQAVQGLRQAGLDPALCDGLPSTGSTVHRLLGAIADSPRFRHHAEQPLPFELIVVDEASMLDLPLMTKLVEAVADGAQLLLLGDPDQLPSVEAGDVLAAIVRASGDGATLRSDDAAALRPLLGDNGDVTANVGSALTGRRVQLRRAYRQHAQLDLAPLAAAVRCGDADATLTLLREGRLAGVHFDEDSDEPLPRWGETLLGHWRALATADDPALALALASRVRLLTALREGAQGARGLNVRIEERLNPGGRRGAAFHGRLLLITENSYRHRLFNGDVGLCLKDGRGVLTAWFPGGDDGAPRGFHPTTLPVHESAFAMTVHKAQGSEFDQVWLQLPRRDNRVLSRELLYTGLTRARSALYLGARAEVLRATLARHADRLSALSTRLGAAAAVIDAASVSRDSVPYQPRLF